MIQFEHSYHSLPSEFYEEVLPSAAVQPELIAVNRPLAIELGIQLDQLSNSEIAAIFSGMKLPASSKPIALAYAGHQFGNFVPQLGDGRAILIGELLTKEGKRFDLHLKGAGRTRFSRGGDGRSALGPVIREYIVSESMHALGIPSSRALAAIRSGENVYREDAEPGGIFARIASSHIRVGTFEYFYARRDFKNLRILTDYAIQRHYPELEASDDKYFAFFTSVARRKLELVAKWMGVGFIHGVMNTDNTSISGETIDFGPCAFMDAFSHNKVYSYIDRGGRYAYSNQPVVAMWNLSILANCLLPLLDGDENKNADRFSEFLDECPRIFDSYWLQTFSRKFGIFDPQPGDKTLIIEFLESLEKLNLDFTNSFREMPDRLESDAGIYPKLKARLETQSETLEQATTLMNANNPYIIPRNHQVERAIQAANAANYTPFEKLLNACTKPFEATTENKGFAVPPKPEEEIKNTFCGT